MNIPWDQDEYEFYMTLSDAAKYTYFYDLLIVGDSTKSEEMFPGSNSISYEEGYRTFYSEEHLVVSYIEEDTLRRVLGELNYDGILTLRVDSIPLVNPREYIFPNKAFFKTVPVPCVMHIN